MVVGVCRLAWLDYFSTDSSIVVAFWSATLEVERLDRLAKQELPEAQSPHGNHPGVDVDGLSVGESEFNEGLATDSTSGSSLHVVHEEETAAAVGASSTAEDVHVTGGATPIEEVEGRAAILCGEELLQLLVRVSPVAAGSVTTVGMVRNKQHALLLHIPTFTNTVITSKIPPLGWFFCLPLALCRNKFV